MTRGRPNDAVTSLTERRVFVGEYDDDGEEVLVPSTWCAVRSTDADDDIDCAVTSSNCCRLLTRGACSDELSAIEARSKTLYCRDLKTRQVGLIKGHVILLT